MRRRPKNYGVYHAYALIESNEETLPKDGLIRIVIDCSDTFDGIALYKEKLSESIIKELHLSYLGVCWDE